MARKTPEEAEKTRTAIVDAALAVFAEQGFARAQLEEIAARARVTRGAVYHHFPDKDALLAVVLAERWPVAAAPVVEPLETKRGEEAVRGFVVAYLEALEADPTLRALLAITRSGGLPKGVEVDGLGQKGRAIERWLDLLDGHLRAAGSPRRPPVRARSEAIVAALLGHSLLADLVPTRATPSAHARAELILGGALAGPARVDARAKSRLRGRSRA